MHERPRTALLWVLWSWSKQVCITDSLMVHRGITDVLEDKPLRAKKSHKRLWDKIKAAIDAKGNETFKVIKVKAHQTEEETTKATTNQKDNRQRNEEADKLVVQGARERNIATADMLKGKKIIIGTMII